MAENIIAVLFIVVMRLIFLAHGTKVRLCGKNSTEVRTNSGVWTKKSAKVGSNVLAVCLVMALVLSLVTLAFLFISFIYLSPNEVDRRQ